MPDVPILLCLFHVMTAWAKALQQKVRDKSVIAQMGKDLAAMARLTAIPQENPSKEDCEAYVDDMIETFCTKYQAQPAFVQYFKRTWAHKAGAAT